MARTARLSSSSRSSTLWRTWGSTLTALTLAGGPDDDPAVVDPRLDGRGGERGQAFDVRETLDLDPAQHRRAEQRMREAGVAAARLAPGRERAAEGTRGLDRPRDGGIALGVGGEND